MKLGRPHCGRFVVFFLSSLGVLCGAENDDLDFAEKLQEKGFLTLAARQYAKLDQEGKIPKKERDRIYRSLFKLYNDMSGRTRDVDEQRRYKEEGKKYFDKIENKNDDALRLELLEANRQVLKTIAFQKEEAKNDEAAQLVEKGRKTFQEMITVVDRIRDEMKKKMDDYDQKDEADQKKMEKEKREWEQLDINVNLLFGEAVVLYANIVGRSDSDARKWLLKMAETYEDFVSRYYETAYAILGNLYLGEANILLGNYVTPWKENREGYKLGILQFNEAILSLKNMDGFQEWRDAKLLEAYIKLTGALELVEQREEAIKAIDEMMKWRNPAKVSPTKDSDLHVRLMYMLEKKCKLLKALHEKTGKAQYNSQLAATAIEAKALCEKLNSPWKANFIKILSEIKITGLAKSADLCFLKAEDAYKAWHKATEVKELQDEDEDKDEAEIKKKLLLNNAYPQMAEAVEFYRETVGLAQKEGKEKAETFIPMALYKMGTCFYTTNNYPMALACLLRAVEMFPSDKYPAKDAPDIHRKIGNCAKMARECAKLMYKDYGRGRFEESLYDKTLEIIEKYFPEEGGDPSFYRAELRMINEKWEEAVALYEKIGKDSSLYKMAQYQVTDCLYQAIKKREAEKKPDSASKDFRQPREELIARLQKVVDTCRNRLEKPKDMDETRYEILEGNRKKALTKTLKRMALVYRDLGQTEKARASFDTLLSLSQDDVEGQRQALTSIIFLDYKTKDLDNLKKDLARVEKIPEDPENWPASKRKADLGNFYTMVANLLMSAKISPLEAEIRKLRKEKADEKLIAKKEKDHAELCVERAGWYARILDVTGERNGELLKNIIGILYQYDPDVSNTIKYLELFFQWNPEKPALDTLYPDMMGKKPEDWDRQIGPFLDKLTVFQKNYTSFLDALFDSKDFSKISIKELRELLKDKNAQDRPRNYATAIRIFEAMENDIKKDRNFEKQVYPELLKKMEDVRQADYFYTAKYILAKCYRRQNKHKEAAELYAELLKYFIEYPDIRIQRARAALDSGTPEGIKAAAEDFTTLLNMKFVPEPTSNNFKPIDYYSLWFGYTMARIAQLGDKPDCDQAISVWKTLRQAICSDLGYFSKNGERWRRIGIDFAERAEHDAFIAEVRSYFEKTILPLIKKSPKDDPVKNETWDGLMQLYK